MTSLRPAPGDPADATPGDEIPPFAPLVEQGQTGLKRVSGYVNDEFLLQLKGRKGVQIFREIGDNSAVMGGFLLAVTELLRQIEWSVEPASNKAEDRANGQMLEGCMDDMSHSWGDMIMEIASFVQYGWEWSEIMYKRRFGPWERDSRRRSKYSDGLWGWRKISGRSQDSMLRWVFDENGGILALVQQAPPRYERKVISIEKSLLFRTTTAKGNPEGRSQLRSAYEPWYFLKRFREILATGVERDLTGVPVGKIPPELFTAPPGSPKALQLEAWRTMVRSVRRNEQEGLLIPWSVDENKNPEYDFELLTSGGTRQFDIPGIIESLKTEMLQAVLADFLMVGHENNGGSYALHTDKTGLFRTRVDALAQSIADVFNRHAVPRLFALNGNKPNELPKIVASSVDPPDLTQLAAFVSALTAAGYQWFPDPTLEKFLRKAARLPEIDPQIESMHEVGQRQAAIIALAQQRMEMLGLQQQAQQGELAMEQTRLGVAQQAIGLHQQSDQLALGPGEPDPIEQARGELGVQSDKVKLDQEKTKLQQLRSGPAGKARPPTRGNGRKPVKKSMSAFGIDHG